MNTLVFPATALGQLPGALSGRGFRHGGAVHASVKSRYRQWATHKLATWEDQFGTSGRVGAAGASPGARRASTSWRRPPESKQTHQPPPRPGASPAAVPSPVGDRAAPRPGRFKAVRDHDPCISSAAHFLNLSMKES